jgi:hypothetical protein
MPNFTRFFSNETVSASNIPTLGSKQIAACANAGEIVSKAVMHKLGIALGSILDENHKSGSVTFRADLQSMVSEALVGAEITTSNLAKTTNAIRDFVIASVRSHTDFTNFRALTNEIITAIPSVVNDALRPEMANTHSLGNN